MRIHVDKPCLYKSLFGYRGARSSRRSCRPAPAPGTCRSGSLRCSRAEARKEGREVKQGVATHPSPPPKKKNKNRKLIVLLFYGVSWAPPVSTKNDPLRPQGFLNGRSLGPVARMLRAAGATTGDLKGLVDHHCVDWHHHLPNERPKKPGVKSWTAWDKNGADGIDRSPVPLNKSTLEKRTNPHGDTTHVQTQQKVTKAKQRNCECRGCEMKSHKSQLNSRKCHKNQEA